MKKDLLAYHAQGAQVAVCPVLGHALDAIRHFEAWKPLAECAIITDENLGRVRVGLECGWVGGHMLAQVSYSR